MSRNASSAAGGVRAPRRRVRLRAWRSARAWVSAMTRSGAPGATFASALSLAATAAAMRADDRAAVEERNAEAEQELPAAVVAERRARVDAEEAAVGSEREVAAPFAAHGVGVVPRGLGGGARIGHHRARVDGARRRRRAAPAAAGSMSASASIGTPVNSAQRLRRGVNGRVGGALGAARRLHRQHRARAHRCAGRGRGPPGAAAAPGSSRSAAAASRWMSALACAASAAK